MKEQIAPSAHLELISSNSQNILLPSISRNHLVFIHWDPTVSYISNYISRYMFGCFCIYNPTRETMSHKDMRANKNIKRTRVRVYLLRLSTIPSEVTLFCTVITFQFGFVFLLTTLASMAFGHSAIFWLQIL